jgi:hypothetical protein
MWAISHPRLAEVIDDNSQIGHAMCEPEARAPDDGAGFATSARCRSAAQRLFFKGEIMTIEKSPERGPAAPNPLLGHRREYLLQGPIRVLGDQSKDMLRVVLQGRAAGPRAAWASSKRRAEWGMSASSSALCFGEKLEKQVTQAGSIGAP